MLSDSCLLYFYCALKSLPGRQYKVLDILDHFCYHLAGCPSTQFSPYFDALHSFENRSDSCPFASEPKHDSKNLSWLRGAWVEKIREQNWRADLKGQDSGGESVQEIRQKLTHLTNHLFYVQCIKYILVYAFTSKYFGYYESIFSGY